MQINNNGADRINYTTYLQHPLRDCVYYLNLNLKKKLTRFVNKFNIVNAQQIIVSLYFRRRMFMAKSLKTYMFVFSYFI